MRLWGRLLRRHGGEEESDGDCEGSHRERFILRRYRIGSEGGCSLLSTVTPGWLESHLHGVRPTALNA